MAQTVHKLWGKYRTIWFFIVSSVKIVALISDSCGRNKQWACAWFSPKLKTIWPLVVFVFTMQRLGMRQRGATVTVSCSVKRNLFMFLFYRNTRIETSDIIFYTEIAINAKIRLSSMNFLYSRLGFDWFIFLLSPTVQEMKAMLYSSIEQAPSAELIDADVLARYYATFDEQFFHYCDKELAKINTFYSGEWSQCDALAAPEITLYSLFDRKNGRGHPKVCKSAYGIEWNSWRWFRNEKIDGATQEAAAKEDGARTKTARAKIGLQRILFGIDFVTKLSNTEFHRIPKDPEETR